MFWWDKFLGLIHHPEAQGQWHEAGVAVVGARNVTVSASTTGNADRLVPLISSSQGRLHLDTVSHSFAKWNYSQRREPKVVPSLRDSCGKHVIHGRTSASFWKGQVSLNPSLLWWKKRTRSRSSQLRKAESKQNLLPITTTLLLRLLTDSFFQIWFISRGLGWTGCYHICH